jgi:hypothetical protein
MKRYFPRESDRDRIKREFQKEFGFLPWNQATSIREPVIATIIFVAVMLTLTLTIKSCRGE